MTFRSSRYKQFAAWNKVRTETGFRSGYEVEVAKHLPDGAVYEAVRIPYSISVSAHYIPDWILPDQCILIEAKGRFSLQDRAKMLHIKTQYPGLDIRILLQHPQEKLTKKSTTTYAMWCRKNGFPCAQGPEIPEDWLKHTPTEKQKRAFRAIMEEQTYANGRRGRKRIPST